MSGGNHKRQPTQEPQQKQRPLRPPEETAPPIGIEPQYIWYDHRMTDLRAAIIRYLNEKLDVPVVWITEYNQLCKCAERRRKRKDDST